MSIQDEDVVDVDAKELEHGINAVFATWLFENFLRIRNRLTGGTGVNGSFTTADAKTVTVVNGIITDIT